MEKIIKLPLPLPIGQIYEIDGEYYKTALSNDCFDCDLDHYSELCNKVNISCNNTIFKKIDKYEVLFSIEKDSDK